MKKFLVIITQTSFKIRVIDVLKIKIKTHRQTKIVFRVRLKKASQVTFRYTF